jgi:hypothetical protein
MMSLFGKNVEGSGRVITETRPTPEFHAVALDTIGTLILDQGTSAALVVEGEDNILAEIKTEVDAGRLIINAPESNLRLHPTQPLVYRLTVPVVDEIALSSSGSIEAGSLNLPRLAVRLNGTGSLALAQLTAQALTIGANGSGAVTVPQLATATVEVSLSGSGSVTLAGHTQQQTVNLSGSGRHTAADLASQDAQVRVSGSGSVLVRVQATLLAQLSGSGSISYIGNPTVTQQRTGSGRVHQQAED